MIQRIAKLSWLLGILIALYNLYYFRSGLSFSFIIVGTCLISLLAISNKSERWSNNSVFLLAALGVGVLIHLFTPNVLVDDTGFVIRYMEQIQDGCFYCFNASDGPVFGISGFIYGLAVLIPSLLGIFPEEAIIEFYTWLGMILTVFFCFKIIQYFSKKVGVTLLLGTSIMLFSSNMHQSFSFGLETALHLAIISAALYYFILNQSKRFWLLITLAVISKLDAAPLAMVAGSLFIFRNFKSICSNPKPWIIDFLKYSVVPMTVFVAFTIILFGGPFPHSAAAKLEFHYQSSSHWFPYLEFMVIKGEMASYVKVGIGIWMLHNLLALAQGRVRLYESVFGLGFIGTMALYYIYNPAERMIWYYALPELLLGLQIMVSTTQLMQKSNYQQIGVTLVVLGIGVASIPMVIGSNIWCLNYFNTVEGERLLIGEDLARWVTEEDTLLAGHGHFTAHVGGYVLDLSGLNSEVTVERYLDFNLILQEFKPQWVAYNTTPYTLSFLSVGGYKVEKMYYSINKYGNYTWAVFRRDTQEHDILRISGSSPPSKQYTGAEYVYISEGSSVFVNVPERTGKSRLFVGIENLKSQESEVWIKGKTLDTLISLPDINNGDKYQTINSIELPLKKYNEIETLVISGDSLRVYDPIIER